MKKRKKLYNLILLIILIVCSCNKKDEKKIIKEDYKFIADKVKKSHKEGDQKRTKLNLKEYLNKALNNNNLLYSGKAYNRLGLYYEKFNETDSAYYFYNNAILFFIEIKDSIRLGKVYSNKAIIESSFGDYEKSNTTAIKALNYFNNNKKYSAVIYNNLGINYRKQKLFKGAINYYQKAINLSNNNKNIIEYKNNIANVYKDLKEYSKSIEILETLLTHSFFKIEPKTQARIIDNLAHTKWLQNPKKNVLKELVKAKLIREEEKDFNGLKASYAHLSDYYYNLNKNESLEYAYKMYNVSKKEKSPYDVMEAIDKISSKEKPEKALIYVNERIRIGDSLQLAKEKSQYKYALVKYESEENEKKALQNKLVAQEQKTQKQFWTFIGLTSFLGFVSYVFYKRNKTKKEKIVEVYNTETRLAKKIHDVLANDMYLVMNKLQKEKRENTSILYDLEKIYTLTRNISRENSPVITGKLFEGFFKQLFVDFTSDTCKIMNKGLSEVNLNALQKEKQIVLYRLLQELLVNMKKHSQASLVIVAFSEIKDTLKVEYKDNGVGVDTIEMKSGLKNMETRIKSIGGTITFDLETQKGFHVTFRFKK
ncbi:tetratricopeptide repeat-containing sensor histidine kinase [uncultured Tenacibaculum sp.]|uniref:tetratricopeptide repeat-containing sensor histidine kinase n=1 Tax=uncultured Tenacibaculum sp. TaxID=174713 RepID=UPI002616D2F0|nr:tetratricopeptide repeat-containing sensor histidine kinase [uncultured Tenacibaculum sp.]